MIEQGTYEVLRDRLLASGKTLAAKADALNKRGIFGAAQVGTSEEGPDQGGASPSPSAGESPSGGASPSASASAGGGQPLTIGTTTNGELQFDPTTASVATGSQVALTFENRDIVPHNLTFGPPINAKTSTVVQPGASEDLSFTAPAPGSYEFLCTLHPGMDGTLEVTP